MRFESSSFAALLKPVDRRAFGQSVVDHDADRYGKSFSSWDHLVALVYAQLSGAESLRGLEADWNAHSHRHYHLGSDRLSRSTLSDANQRRPWQVFGETMTALGPRSAAAGPGERARRCCASSIRRRSRSAICTAAAPRTGASTASRCMSSTIR